MSSIFLFLHLLCHSFLPPSLRFSLAFSLAFSLSLSPSSLSNSYQFGSEIDRSATSGFNRSRPSTFDCALDHEAVPVALRPTVGLHSSVARALLVRFLDFIFVFDYYFCRSLRFRLPFSMGLSVTLLLPGRALQCVTRDTRPILLCHWLVGMRRTLWILSIFFSLSRNSSVA